MSDDSIVSFFNSVLDNEDEKKIIRLISQGLDEEKIIEILLGVKGKEE
ncbi:MAG: hypothetical protein Q7J35_12010 [Candidatus Methanoperedens sp.]|nr:hypothetical protein [Candidatus Methanoperedens sp.]